MKKLTLNDFDPSGLVTITLQIYAVPPANGGYFVPSVGILGELELSPSDSQTFLEFLSFRPRKKVVEPRLTYMRCDNGELGFHITDFDLTRMLGCCRPCSDKALEVNVAILNWKQSLHDGDGVQWRRKLAEQGLDARCVICGLARDRKGGAKIIVDSAAQSGPEDSPLILTGS